MNDGEKRLPARKPFPKTGFQITTEKDPPDDLPRYEQKQTNTPDNPSVRQKRKAELSRHTYKPSIKLKLAAVRMLFDFLVVRQVTPFNPFTLFLLRL